MRPTFTHLGRMSLTSVLQNSLCVCGPRDIGQSLQPTPLPTHPYQWDNPVKPETTKLETFHARLKPPSCFFFSLALFSNLTDENLRRRAPGGILLRLLQPYLVLQALVKGMCSFGVYASNFLFQRPLQRKQCKHPP